jgi:hypothetical protein
LAANGCLVLFLDFEISLMFTPWNLNFQAFHDPALRQVWPAANLTARLPLQGGLVRLIGLVGMASTS